MVLVSYSGKEINAKIVFYGPGLCGKTTNLEYIYGSIPSKNRGKMVSMKTKTERTLFFDFLPLNLGELAGFKTRFLLYTVPGQVYYNATRKLVLKGVDAVIFVADSQRGKMDENIESLQNLRDNLKEHGLSLDEVPYVLQYNKRDLPDVYPLDELERELNRENVPSFEGIATTGEGVFETFKAVSKLLLAKLSKEIGAAVVDEGGGSAAAAARAAARSGTAKPEMAPREPSIPPVDLGDSNGLGQDMMPEPRQEEPAAEAALEPSPPPLEISGPEPEGTHSISEDEPQKTRGLWKWLRKDGPAEEPISSASAESTPPPDEVPLQSARPEPEPEAEPETVSDLGVTRGLGVFSEALEPEPKAVEPPAPPPAEPEEPVTASQDSDITHDLLAPAVSSQEQDVPTAEPPQSAEPEVAQAGPVEARSGEIIVPVIVPRSVVGDRLEIRLVLHLAQEGESDDEFEADARARGII